MNRCLIIRITGKMMQVRLNLALLCEKHGDRRISELPR